jgi:serine/threonine-protein kinase
LHAPGCRKIWKGRFDVTAYDRQRAHRLLTRLLDMPLGERSAALEHDCAGDEALRAAVTRLLRAAESPESLLDSDSGWSDSLWAGLADETAEQETPIVSGTVVGPYRVLEEIGRGGMAIVYRAERADGELQRAAAFKILKLGIDTEEVVRRFEQERQILADLDHPDIARLFDAGRTGDGRPYFVMELVEGQPLDRYCDEHRLSVEERLELFCAVTRAVDYAHRHLVVHRDLKPSNILVDREGNVKLLDFGIARLLDAGAGGELSAPPTRTMHLMTPEYASPEQVRGERVTTASDVYQLGLLLYELLSGRRAYVLPPGQHYGELQRMICEQSPTRPSEAAGRSSGLVPASGESVPTPVTASQLRRSSPARLRRRLRGDLDNIVLKALSKEPNRRYGSADRLGQDIRRNLDGLPVSARADTWAYRGRKFFQRHAIGTGVTALVFVFIAAMVSFYTIRIQQERDRAEAEADKARQVSQFLTGLFRGVDPREARGTELTARELLDRGLGQVDRRLAAQPEIHADMLDVLGRTYLELGSYEAAEKLLTQALELRRSRLGVSHPDVAVVLGDLGALRHAQGRYEEARTLLEQAVEVLEASEDADRSRLAETLQVLGVLLFREFGEHANAAKVLERALAYEEGVSGERSEPVARILQTLGSLQFETGALVAGEATYRRVLDIFESELGADHPWAGSALISLAFVRLEQGKLEGLEDMYRRGLTILEHAYGPQHGKVATALNNLGTFLTKVGRHDEAIDVLDRALQIRIKAVGASHPDVAYPLASLGDASFAARRWPEARRYYERSAALRSADPDVRRFDGLQLHSLVRLGRIEGELDDQAASARHFNRALALWANAPASTDPRLVPSLLPLGRWLVEQHRCTEAVPLLQRTQDLLADRSSVSRAGELTGLLARCMPTT